jgi:hypothetical protein
MKATQWVKTRVAAMAVAAGFLCSGVCVAEEKAAAEATPAVKVQATCPVAGGAIDKTQFVDANGFRIYACCAGCLAKIKADPDVALAKIRENGETPEAAPAKKDAGAKKKPRCCEP